jgi:hypothetical protein
MLALPSNAVETALCAGTTRCNVPEASDRVFVVEPEAGMVCPDLGCNLQTVHDPILGRDVQVCFPHGLTIENPATLEIPIPIDRVVGPVDGSGRLTDWGAQLSAGTLAPKAKVTVVTRDFVFLGHDSAPMRDYAYEVTDNHRVVINDWGLGPVRGVSHFENQAFVRNDYEVPIDRLRFPERRSDLSGTELDVDELKPVPVENILRIDVAHVQTPSPLDALFPNLGLRYCTQVEWVSLEIGAMSPIVLIHGNNSDPGFWDRHGFAEELQSTGLPVDGCEDTCSLPIRLETSPVAENGQTLGGLRVPGALPGLGPVERIVRSFGADSYHIIAHSKGGLDSREFLAYYGKDIQLVSHTTLGTPHNGTQLADLKDAQRVATTLAARTEYADLPAFVEFLNARLPADRGTPDLTTYAAIDFNRVNIPLLPDADYHQIAADADRNGSLSIDLEEEWVALKSDNAKLDALAALNLAQPLVDTVYRTLRETRFVAMGLTYRRVPGVGGPASMQLPILRVLRDITGDNLNDTLVPMESGLAFGEMRDTRTTRSYVLEGAVGRNHSSIAEADIVPLVFDWLVASEQNRGDLR